MIKLVPNIKDNTIYTTWILKINKDSRKRTTKSGEEKTYHSYFTSFPQELYDFFDIQDDTIYLIKELTEDYEIIITDREPKLPLNFVKTKLITRRKNNKNRIPTTSFTLSRKLFNHLDEAKEVIFTLHPKKQDRFRNKLGIISIKII